MSATLPDPGLSTPERAALDDLLASERRETSIRLAGLTRNLDAIVECCALSVSDDEHDPEGPTLGFERAQVAALVDQARHHLDALDKARERLRNGSYGVCDRCGRTIGIDRLLAYVTAETCVECAVGDPGEGVSLALAKPGSTDWCRPDGVTIT